MAALVGRGAELARLLALLDDAAEGRAVAALVSGDAGIGKSRLVSEAGAIAAGRGVTVLCGQCAEIGDSVPYLPFADALRGAALEPAEAARLASAVAARPVLARLLPDGGAAAPREADWGGLGREQMFGAVLGLLAELAAAAPVLLILEDLHWADASTRDLLTFLSRMLHRERVALIGTYRSDDLYRKHPLRAVVADLLRLPAVTSVDLAPLPPSALAELLHGIQNAPGSLVAATLNRIVERAEGNAYYAEELFAAASEAGASGAESLPAGLASLLLARVERLSDAAQQVLRAAAVAGRRADDELVRALVRDVSGMSDAEYEKAVREAVAHQLLVPDVAPRVPGPGPAHQALAPGGAVAGLGSMADEPGAGDAMSSGGGYAFRHALLREAVYADLLPGERTRLHARLAAILAARPGGMPGTAAELAYHSLASHDIPGAFAASVRAGEEAHRLGAPAEEHRHYDQAIALWDRVPCAEKLVGMSRPKLAFRSAASAAVAGDVPRAVQQLRRLRDVLDRAAADGTAPDGDEELRSQVGERLAYYLMQTDHHGAAVEALRAARAAVRLGQGAGGEDGPPTWYQARAMATYAITLMLSEGYGVALGWAQRAQAVARRAGSRSIEADALVTIGMLASRSGNQDEAIGTFTAAYEQAAAARALGVELRAAYYLATERLSRGDLAEAARIAHAGVQRAEAEGLGLAPFGLDLQHLHFQAHYADGYWDHAQEIADGFPVRVTRQPEALLSAMALFIDVARGRAVAGERRAWLEPFWSDTFVAYIARGLYAEQALWRGDTSLALAEAEAAINADKWPAPTPAVIRAAAIALAARADRAVAARACGDGEAAASELTAAGGLLAVAREGARFPVRPKAVLGPEARGWLARCEAEYRRGLGEGSPEDWEKVLAEFGPGYVYETARIQWRLAEALASAGRREEAMPVWRSAVATAERLGAAPLRAALEDLGRRARLGPAGPAAGDAAGSGHDAGSGRSAAALTGRELEVLRLVARGMSNREIAARLFIAPKTASVHVSNILGKLGAASRTEAAAIAHREGL